MRRCILIPLLVLLAVVVAACNGVDSLYVEILELSLPPANGGRTLHIPAIDVNVDVTTFPLGASTWEISPWERNAGHFDQTAWIDFPGNVVIGGHSVYPSGVAGIFYDLERLQAGDVVFVRDGDLQRRYRVTEVRTVDYRDLTVLYPSTDSRVTLITCSVPSYVAAQNLYYERVVVIADEVPRD